MDDIKNVRLNNVEVQANGIIRNSRGRLIARLVDGVDFNGEHINYDDSHIESLVKELKKDKEPGSYYYSWQSNIAMSIYDEMKGKVTVEEANNCAKRFLEMLIRVD